LRNQRIDDGEGESDFGEGEGGDLGDHFGRGWEEGGGENEGGGGRGVDFFDSEEERLDAAGREKSRK